MKLRLTITSGLVAFVGMLSHAAHAQTYSRTDTIVYQDDTANWVLGNVAQQQSSAIVAGRSYPNRVVDQTVYDANTLPWKIYKFGKLQKVLTYNPDGTIATVADGAGHVTTLASWKRGIPQTITFPATPDQPAGATASAQVSDDATVAWVIDETGAKTCYGYDAMLRVNRITYPSEAQLGVCDTSTWSATTITFAQGYPTAYGVPAGHWRQTTLTGNGRHVLVFDALWRPVVDQTLDLGNVPGTTTEVIKRYGVDGHLVFQSYPMNTAGQANYADTTLKGIHTTYDALDRVTQVDQDSELPNLLSVLSTKTVYGPGLKTAVSNPRQVSTITSYMAFDEPKYDWPVDIDAADGKPEEADTDIVRDGFGYPSSIVRHNAAGTVTETRSYVYYTTQELCKTIDPESASTVFGYDAAGNLSWSAGGQALPNVANCDIQYVPATAKVSRTYDARNRILSLVFPDHRGDTTYHYAPDGKTTQLIADNGGSNQVTTNYAYNHRRLLSSESLVWQPLINWPLTYGYDANGHLSSQNWHGLLIDYAPNALGQPTKAGTFASGVSFYPNGALKQFTFGNAIVHTLWQNTRGLPDRSQDTFGGVTVLDDSYDYDANGNVAAISDALPGNRGNRTMGYDGLDRLTSVVSPLFGSGGATYTYDALDNLTRVTIGGTKARDQYYCYDGAWRLTNIKTGGCATGATVVGMSFDVQGNLANKNGKLFDFDFGNRLRSADTSTYVYDGNGLRVGDTTPARTKYTQYNQAGQLVMSGDGSKVDEYVYLSGSLLAIRERDVATNSYTVKYQHNDALGSAVVVTDPNRNVTLRNEYEPYGQLLNGPVVDGPQYTGHVADAATGLDYMQQRYYDPHLGRFLSVDPVTADAKTGANFNRYWYADNSPYTFTDPDGRCPDDNPCHQPLPSNFFRDNFVGRLISHLVGDPIAVFRSDSLNPLTNEVLGPGQVQNAKVGVVLLALPAARAEAGVADELALSTRVNQVHGALDPIAASMRTTAGLDTAEGVRVLGGGGVRDLTPAQRAMLSPGEAAARLPGAHAEVTVLGHASRNGLTPSALEVSRAICPACQQTIREAGGTIVSSTRAEW